MTSANEKLLSLRVRLLRLTDMTSSCKVKCGVRGVGTKSADDPKLNKVIGREHLLPVLASVYPA
jgi:hypothetical protein